MKVQVIGLGYIGLPTASIIAEAGYDVHGFDVNKYVIESINSGKLHIEEKGLDNLVKTVKEDNKFSVSLNVEEADYHIICVPTPFKKDNDRHDPDISCILNAVEKIAPVLTKGSTVILESTSPVGTTEIISKQVKTLRSDLNIAGIDNNPEIYFSYCPERIIPGDMLRELRENDRVIGGIDNVSALKTMELYDTFVKGKCIKTSAGVAEMVKLTENAFRDVNIAFANELSIICDKQKLPVEEVIKYANCHPRVNILNPGPGVGGHCIAVDPWFIVSSNPEEAQLIHKARKINDSKPDFVIKKVREAVEKNPDSKIYCLGLTYKPNVDDFRESPSLMITNKLTEEYGSDKVIGVDPYLKSFRETTWTDMNLVDSIDIIEDKSIVLALVNHKDFKVMSFENNQYIIDFCGLEKDVITNNKIINKNYLNQN